MRPVAEPVDPVPFVDWLDRLPESWRGGPRLASVWGVSEDTANRRLYRWRHESKMAPRAQVEAAIEGLDPDALYTDVYGADPEPRTLTGRKRPSNAGVPITIPEDVLIEAHRLHLDEGLSLRKAGVMFFDRCTSVSPHALSRSLHNTWKQRGWETLTREEAIAQFNRRKVAHLPKCGHPRGCARRTGSASGFCWHHEPDRIVERLAWLRAKDAA